MNIILLARSQGCSMGKQRFFRTTITIPPDLKRRMDAVKETVNWSALACRAFEDKLVEIATRKGEKSMSDVIQRLRGSKMKMEDQAYLDGKRAGTAWANNQATYAHLQRLFELFCEASPGWETWFNRSGGAFSVGERLADVLLGAEGKSRYARTGFWQGVLDPDDRKRMNESLFVRGFADGALDVWVQVKDQI
jgi:hypothetical protein